MAAAEPVPHVDSHLVPVMACPVALNDDVVKCLWYCQSGCQ